MTENMQVNELAEEVMRETDIDAMIAGALGLTHGQTSKQDDEDVILLGLYARISEANDELGVRRQIREMQEQLPQHRWLRGKKVVIVDEYIDNGISAYDITRVRPQYLRMLGDVSTGRLNSVMAWDADRLARQPLDGETLLRQLETSGGRYLLTSNAGDNVDISTGEGSELYRIKGAMAHGETKKTSRRQRAKHKELFESGAFSGGKRRYGYNKDMTEIIPWEAEIIREVAKRCAEGETLSSCVKDLNRRGVPTALSGKESANVDYSRTLWSNQSMKRVLTGPHIIGRRVRDGVVVKAKWEAILPYQLWLLLQTKLANPFGATYKAGGKPNSPLTGLLRCGKCGEKLRMQKISRTGKDGKVNDKRYWQCNSPRGCHGINKADARLSQWIIGEVLAAYQDETFIDRLMAAGDDVENREHMLAQLRGAQAKLEELEEDYYFPKPEARPMDKARFHTMQTRYGKMIDDLKRDLRMMTSKDQIDADLIYSGELNKQWATLPMHVQASLIKFVASHITVKPTGRGKVSTRYSLEREDHYEINWLDAPNAIAV